MKEYEMIKCMKSVIKLKYYIYTLLRNNANSMAVKLSFLYQNCFVLFFFLFLLKTYTLCS